MHLFVIDTLQKKVWAWIRNPVSSRYDHHFPHAVLIRVDQAVDCGLCNVVPRLYNGCAKLLDIGRNWNTLLYTAPQTCSMGDMSGEYAGHGRTGIFQLPGMSTDPCDMGPSITMLKHEAMAADDWHDKGPQDLVTVSLCIQIAMDEMQLCLLPVAYACSYRHHLLAQTTLYMCSAVVRPVGRTVKFSKTHTITQLSPWGTLFTTLTSANHSTTQHHTCGLRL